MSFRLGVATLAFLAGFVSGTAFCDDGVKPDAMAIIKKFEETTNIVAVRDKHNSSHSSGEFELPAQGAKGKLDIYSAKPNKVLIRITIEGFGEIVSAFDGKVGWSLNPQTGAALIEGKALEELKERADFSASLSKPGVLKGAVVQGKEKIDGKECHKLKLVRRSGRESTDYFAVDTGLLVSSRGPRSTPMGEVEIEVNMENYKKFGDMMAAAKTVQKMGNVEQVFTIDNIEFDKVADKEFEMPAEVKDLLKKQ